MMIEENNPALKSWVEVDINSDFPVQNLPFGIFSSAGKTPRAGVAIGNFVLDLAFLELNNHFSGLALPAGIFSHSVLNPFIDLGKATSRAVRKRISELLREGNTTVSALKEQCLIPMQDVQMHMPVAVGDYTDFYSSIDHATNVGTMFRDPANALLPNWKHIPVGYHGRSSSIVISGTPVHRPMGQTKPNDVEPPMFGPCRLLDFELEMAFITHQGKPMGERISTAEAEDYIFGMVIFNDWSARDIQKWEYVPLGPFLAKNFASSISPWVVTLDALEPFRVPGPVQEPKVLPYLEYKGNKNIDIKLEVLIQPAGGEENTVSRSNYHYMYWNMNQQLAHHTVNGCNIRSGDMMASGTISGPTRDSFGSMLELSWKGTTPVKLGDGTERNFIADNDSVIMRAHCESSEIRIGFGEVRTKVLPSR